MAVQLFVIQRILEFDHARKMVQSVWGKKKCITNIVEKNLIQLSYLFIEAVSLFNYKNTVNFEWQVNNGRYNAHNE